MDTETSTSAPARVIGKPWPKGVSGNPGGLRRGVPGLIEQARRLALSYAPKAIATLAGLLDHQDARVRVAAAEGLLDRAGLRPYSLEPERVEVSAAVDVDALRALLATRVAGLVAAKEPAALPASTTAVEAAPGVPEVPR